jgi:hypothetical protein
MRVRHLYEITDQYKNIADLLDDPTMPTEDISAALTVIEGDLQAKASNCAVMLQGMDTDIDVLKAEEKRLSERRKSIEGRRDWLKSYVKEQMERINMPKIKTPTFTLAIQNNPPKVDITSEKDIPTKYLTIIPQTTVPDKKRIAEALKTGKEVPGATLTQGTSLRIR